MIRAAWEFIIVIAIVIMIMIIIITGIVLEAHKLIYTCMQKFF